MKSVPVFSVPSGSLGLPIAGEHSLVTGVTGSGKSTTIRVAVAGAAYDPDCALVMCDPKRGAEFGPWTPRAARVARTPAECADALLEVVALMEARYELLADEGRQTWRIGTDGPGVLVVVDELRVLFRGGSDRNANQRAEDALSDLLMMGRAAGIAVLAGTQRPSADSLDLSMRDQFGVRVAHRLGSIESVRMVFPDLADAAPAHRLPEGIEHAGRCYVMTDGANPVPAWTMWLDGSQVPAIAHETAHLAPSLELPTVTAAGPQRAVWAAPQADADAAVLAALADGPMPYAELATVVGLSPDACRGRLRRLEQAGKVTHAAGSAEWQLVAS